MTTNRCFFVLAGCAIVLLGKVVKADEVLIDRPPNPLVLGARDQDYPDFPEFSTFVVASVLFDTNVELTAITGYYTNLGKLWPQNELAPAVFNVFQGDLQHDDDPRLGKLVNAFYMVDENGLEVTWDLTKTASPLILQGDTQYWIGLTPKLSFGIFGNQNRQASDVGPNSMVRNPGGGFGLGSEWTDVGDFFGFGDYSAAITIRGNVIPEPGLLGFLFVGLLIAVFPRHRRRRDA